MPKIWEKVRRGGFLFSLVIGLLIFSLINLNNIAEASLIKQFNYQGKLLNSGGTSVSDGAHNLKFSIFAASSGGTCIWTAQGTCGGTVNPKSVTTSQGIFTTILGESGDNALNLDFTGISYYLEIEVFNGSTYDVLSPRLQMGAMLNAINANNLIGDGYINITGTPTGSGIGDGTVYINPSTANVNDTLLGMAVGGSLKAKVDAEGDMDLAGALSSGGLNVDSGVLYTDFDNNIVSQDSFGKNLNAVSNAGSRNWKDIAMSSTGQYQTAVVSSGYVYRSTDYGANWTELTSVGSKNWYGIAMSSTGQYQTAVVSSGYVYRSTDYGANWTELTSVGSKTWYGAAISSTGQYQTAVVNSGYVYRSTDYGANWTELTSAGLNAWDMITMSSSGQYQTTHLTDDYIYRSTDFGASWSPVTSPGYLSLTDITSSMSGQYQFATEWSGYIYKSTDYGASWSSITSAGSRNWRSVAISSTSQYCIALVDGGYVYRSIDFGSNWDQSTSDTTRSWKSVAMSSTGKLLSAVVASGNLFSSSIDTYVGINTTTPGQALTVAGSITSALKAGYLSADNVLLSSLEGGLYFGNTSITENQWENTGFAQNWVARATDTTRNWNDIAISSDGKIQTAVLYSGTGRIFGSTDYGVTWSQRNISSTEAFYKISMSSDGKIQTAVAEGYISISNDYGTTWTQTAFNATAEWYGIAMSSDGKIQTAVASTGYIYGSTDYGNTWTQKTSDTARNWNDIAMSSDGKIQTAVASTGYIYGSTDYGNTWTQKTSDTARNWNDIAMSSDGKIQTAVVPSGYIYSSTNYGATWTQKTSDATRSWRNIVMSSDGKIQTAVVASGYIYGSTDYGATWSQKTFDTTRNWKSIATSSDGKIQAAAVFGGYVYESMSDTFIIGGNLGIGTSMPIFNLTVNGNIGGLSSSVLKTLIRGNAAFSDADNTGQYTTMKIGVDGLPIIAYYNVTDGDIMVTHCSNAQCTTGTTTQFYSSNDIGNYRGISLAIGTDGLPVIAYSDNTSEDLMVMKCGNIYCTANNTTTNVDSSGSTGLAPDITIGNDGLPVIAYYDYTAGYMQAVKCTNASCSTYGTAQQIVAIGWSSGSSNVTIKVGPDGLPVLAYFIPSGPATAKLGIAKCGNSDCSSGNTTTIIRNQTNTNDGIGYEQIGLAIDGNNIPIFSYYNISSWHLWVVKCGNTSCSSGNIETQMSYNPSSGDYGVWSSIAFGTDGLPIISSRNYGVSYLDLLITKCGDTACTSNSTVQIDAGTTDIGRHTSIAIGVNGLPIVSHYDNTNGNLNVLSCADSACSQSSATTITGGSTVGDSSVPYQTISGLQFSNPTSYSNLSFLTNGTEKMTITQTGLVGIGDITPVSGLSVGITNSDGVSADFSGRVGVGTSNPTFMLTVDGNVGGATSPTLSTISRTITPIVTSSDDGDSPSIAIGVDGLPIMTYYDAGIKALFVLKCGNAQCTSGNNTVTQVNQPDGYDNGSHNRLVIGADGLPIITYYNVYYSDNYVIKCGNISCSSGNVSTRLIETGTTGYYPTIVIGSDGLPIIASQDYTNGDLMINKCTNASCSTYSAATKISDAGGDTVGTHNSITISTDGYPIISYYNDTDDDLMILKCKNLSCSSYETPVQVGDSGADDWGQYSSIDIGSDGLPVIAYMNITDDDLIVTKCNDTKCTAYTNTIITNGTVYDYDVAITIGSDGLPILSSYGNGSSWDLYITKCTNLACSTYTGPTLVPSGTADISGMSSSIAIGTNGMPIVASQDNSGNDLVISACADLTCASSSGSVMSGGSSVGASAVPYQTVNALQFSNPTAFSDFSFLTNGTEKMTITQAGLVGIGDTTPTSGLSVGITNSDSVSADFLGSVGIGTSTPAFKLQVNGNIGATTAPILTSIVSESTTITNTDNVGNYTSIAIGTDGLPVISYSNTTDGDLMITKCGNSACSSGNTTTQITDAETVGEYTSIAIGTDGLPVISYYNTTDDDLMIIKCGNSNCSSGNTTTQVTDTDNIGRSASIAIGVEGLPVISHYNYTDGDLMITKCGNSACSSGNTTTQVTNADNVGNISTSIAMGTDGLPVISYYNTTDGDLMITKCGNSACSSGNTTTQVTDADNFGNFPSIVIGKNGLPLVSHYNSTDGDLMITKCGNSACSSGNTTTQVVNADDIGNYTSIVVDSEGLPIISHSNYTDLDLMITKCGNADCSFGNTTTQIMDTDDVGYRTSVVIGIDSMPIISHSNFTDGDLMIKHCADQACSLSSGSAISGSSIGGWKGNSRSSGLAYQTINALQFSNPTAYTNFTFSTNGVNRLTITPSGLIGIGTSTPTEALQVMGNIAISKSNNASSESWAATSTSTVTDRYGNVTVWTGSKMIVWGGNSATESPHITATGYIFDPIANSWVATSTGTNCPSGKIYPVAVWTGSKMIVWGGKDNSSVYTNTGGIYDPTTNTWKTITTTNAPTGRAQARAVWTGSKMIVWGGETASTPTYSNTGGIYDPVSDTWTTMGGTAPSAKIDFTATWTGSKMIVIAGRTGSAVYNNASVYAFDPVANTWSSALTVIPAGRSAHSAIWTGSKIIVWGGRSAASTYLDTGYIYDPANNTWSAAIATSPAARRDHTAIWTGSKMIIWGGGNASYLTDGSIYDPVANAWTTMAASNLTVGRTLHTAVWTGSEMIIFSGWNGSAGLNDGGIYTPPSQYGGNLFVEGDGLINGELKTVGPITSGGFYSLSGADLAETYLSRYDLEPGTLITPDILTSGAISISKGIPYDNTVIGVVSTLPGMTLGYGSSPNETYPYSLPIALAGRVPVRVSDENGPINVGDPITSSSIPGVAMKAINEGNTLGTALESFDPTTQGEQCESNPEYTCSKILAYVSMSYIRPSSETELRIEDITLNLSKQVKEQEDKITALESELDGLSTKLTNITFGEDSTNITGEVGVENMVVRLDMSILGKLIANGNLIVNGDSVFSSNVAANKQVEFKNDVIFTKTPTFNTNTAGFAIVKKDMNSVTVLFDQEYANAPIIFADLSLSSNINSDDKSLILAALSNNNLKYSILNQSTKGFTIELTENAPADIRFSWQAISVSTTTTTTKP